MKNKKQDAVDMTRIDYINTAWKCPYCNCEMRGMVCPGILAYNGPCEKCSCLIKRELFPWCEDNPIKIIALHRKYKL